MNKKSKLSSEERTRIHNREYYAKHTEERKEYLREYRRRTRNPLAERRLMLRKTYGITIEQYLDLLSKQGGVCAICHKPETKTLRGKVIHLGVDHNHTTGKMRGLLCFGCNVAIGLMQENSAIMRNAAEYIDRWLRE